MLSEEQKRRLKEDIKIILQQVNDETNFCGCYEGDIQNAWPEAQEDAAQKIMQLLKAWSMI